MSDDACFREALERFQDLLERAEHIGLREPTAMTLATANAQGRPWARMVLLRGVDERGFVFYTNSHSEKGRQLAVNPQAALCFYWEALGEQARIQGRVEPTPPEESDAYWAKRSRESQLGAWASDQSQTLSSRAELEQRVAEFTQRFAGGEVPRPEHWIGYRVVPDRIEFWQSQPARLHDRLVYERAETGWRLRRLYP